MFERLKKIFNKENYNFSEGYVNPLEYHPIVHFVTKSYGFCEDSVPPWTTFLLIFMTCCAVSAISFAALATFHGCEILDVAVIIEAGAYMIVISYKLLIVSCTKLNVQDFHAFFRALKADFKYVCTDGSRYRKRFFENQLQTWKICILVAVAMSILCVGMVFMATLVLIYFLLVHDSDSGESRPLLFPFWVFSVDFSKSPTYEIAFVYSNICVLAYGYNYIFMIVTQILWIREIATKADLVIWGISDLMEGIYPATNEWEADNYSKIIKYRMRAIIQQHQSMYNLTENYSRVFKKFLMFEQIFCGPVACLTAYSAAEPPEVHMIFPKIGCWILKIDQHYSWSGLTWNICLVIKLNDGDVNYILILLCIAAIVVAFVPSYLCSFLRMKVSSIVDACWGTPFWNAGPVIRPYLVLIIQRSLRPLPLRFGGFQEVSVQTFSNKMASAYSCFNMLRQSFK